MPGPIAQLPASRPASPAGCSRRRRRLIALLAGCAGLVGLLQPPSALAIPEKEAMKKLAVIPVFVLTDAKGIPLPLQREKALVLPLYLDRGKAEQELAAFVKANPTIKAGVLPMPMNVALERVQELNKSLKDRKLLSPVIPTPSDLSQARSLLGKQGIDQKTIQEGLSVPVFFTKPLITVKTPQGERGLFFFDYASLQKAMASIPDRNKLTVQAADLSAVMDQIVKQAKDTYAFYPTPEYFRLVEQQSRTKGAGSAGSSAPAAPRR
ncbi:hypothetical protein BBFGKLBO_02258 [Synechococcus sp. CBW1107]|uniref:hypothetical protein n=1 Tax=unclassified Synechococcus TaxID=2626047 RepID=UPI002AD5075C|nr:MULTISPECIES: hypothetical protein [unclassified Synechococcus]CAK6697460.1 hypothetical protein BBFGKLBO_02258 [Synechococcus sp. CBW1107]